MHVTGRSVKETIHMKGWGFNSIQVYNLLLNMKSAICLTVELSVLFNNFCRNCIGQNFALNEEKVILSRVLRQ